MKNRLKIILTGLDNAGKTSILIALEKKYNFESEILNLKPTIKINYHKTLFLNKECIFWDMGGQEKYRNFYLRKRYMYFLETDLLIYIFDIQDKSRFNESLTYLNMILRYFLKNKLYIPIIIAFHKYDPDLESHADVNKNVSFLTNAIKGKYPMFNVTFQQTSIYDIVSIVQLISSGLSNFDRGFLELSMIFEVFLKEVECSSLKLFDANGIIVTEANPEPLSMMQYNNLLKNTRENLILLKKTQEDSKKFSFDSHISGKDLLNYIFKMKVKDPLFYVSAIIKKQDSDEFVNQVSPFLEKITGILEKLL